MLDKNELEELKELDEYSKEYAILHLFYTTRNIINRIFNFIWYYL